MTINRRRGPPRAAASATMNESAQGSILQASRQVNQSQMSNVTTASRRGFLDQSKKKIIWDFIVEILEDVQRGNISVKDAYKNFIELYYQEKSEELATDWQKYFTQSLWRISLLFFSAPNAPQVNKTLSFVNNIFTNVGTDEEKEQVGFTQRSQPMFIYGLKLAFQSHKDKRQLVRTRVLDVVQCIYAKHSDHPAIVEHPTINRECLKMIGERIRDKHGPVREISAALMKYFTGDKSVVKDLKYFARYDPSPDVKKIAIRSLTDGPGIKPIFFSEHAFDTSSTVRGEAFSILINKPITQLHPGMRCKVLMWGLMADPRIQKTVVQKVIPAWIGQCNDNPIEFLRAVDVGTQDFSVSQTILRHVYSNDFTETFDSIDLGFLNEEKIIPVKDLSIESTMFWIFLIKRFSKLKYHADKLLPTFDVMMKYIKEIIHAIHVEHDEAVAMDRDEDGALLLCLVNVLPICIYIGLEEGNRRLFEKQLKEILLDAALDDVVLVKEGVRLMKIVVDANAFADKMSGIFQETFEPGEEQRSRRNRSSRQSRSRLSDGETPVAAAAVSKSVEQEPSEIVEPMDSDSVHPEEPQGIPPMSETEKKEIKEKVCNLAIQRLRLEANKNKEANAQNYLEAHRLQSKMDEIDKEVNELNAKLQAAEKYSLENPGRPQSMPLDQLPGPSSANSGRRARRAASLISEMSIADTDDPINRQGRNKSMDDLMEEDGAPASQANTTLTDNRVALSGENILKGFVMLGEFLTLHPKLTPFVRQLYENFLTKEFLFDINPRVRQLSLSLLAMIGLIEPEDKRRVMGCLLSALINDKEYDVNCTAFKGTVDMLLKYKFDEFRYFGNGDKLFPNLPAEFNDQNSTAKVLETMFISILDTFAKESPMDNINCEAIKAKGWMKLLYASRINDETVMADLICMWTSKKCAGSPIPYNFGCWLPAFTKVSVANAKLVAKGFLRSLKTIITTVDNNSPLFEADITKISDFIIPLLSPTHLDFDDGDQVHQEFALMLFEDILSKPTRAGNKSLIKITSKLVIVSQNKAYEINNILINIFLKILTSPQTPTINALKMAVKAVSKRLQKQFEGLEDLPNNPGRIQDTSDDEERQDRGAFSDDDSLLSNESIVPASVRSRSRRSASGSAVGIDENGVDSEQDTFSENDGS